MVVRAAQQGSRNWSRSELHGLLNIDKPLRRTSHDVVAKLRRVLGVQKIGHTGTLDPLATGVMVICVGKATKIARFLVGLDKEYWATMRLGGESDTLDAHGNISISERFPDISFEELHRVFRRFIGQQEQIPPMFSAVKHRGQPLYRLARQGKTVERQPRQVYIRSLEICRFEPPRVAFQVSCSSGTYIRVLAADIGKQLGFGAYLLELRRTRLGPFRCEDALPLAQALKLAKAGRLGEQLMPVSRGLEEYPRLVVHPWAAFRVLHGQPMTKEIFQKVAPGAQKGDEVRIVDPQGRLLAMAQLLVHSHQLSRLAPTDLTCRSLRTLS